MTKEQYFAFLDELKLTEYGKYYVEKVLHHIDLAPIQHKINLNSYFSSGTKDRLKLINAIKFIDHADLLPNKRITFEGDVFYLDLKPNFKTKE